MLLYLLTDSKKIKSFHYPCDLQITSSNYLIHLFYPISSMTLSFFLSISELFKQNIQYITKIELRMPPSRVKKKNCEISLDVLQTTIVIAETNQPVWNPNCMNPPDDRFFLMCFENFCSLKSAVNFFISSERSLYVKFSSPQTLTVGHNPPMEKPIKILVREKISDKYHRSCGFDLTTDNGHNENIITTLRRLRHMIILNFLWILSANLPNANAPPNLAKRLNEKIYCKQRIHIVWIGEKILLVDGSCEHPFPQTYSWIRYRLL